LALKLQLNAVVASAQSSEAQGRIIMNGMLTTRSPQGMKTLRDEMEGLLGHFWGDPREGWWTGEIAAPVDVAEMENGFEIRMDVPGMNAKDLNIHVNGNVVMIGGERKQELDEKGKAWHRVERRTGTFTRTVTLPCNVNENEVVAEYVGGVLAVKLPKAADARPKKVPVKG
jgi:HSP20 family protein